jgi:hypothetical protein
MHDERSTRQTDKYIPPALAHLPQRERHTIWNQNSPFRDSESKSLATFDLLNTTSTCGICHVRKKSFAGKSVFSFLSFFFSIPKRR